MRKWILENTDIKETEYDQLINQNTVIFNTKNKSNNNESSNHPIINIILFTLKKPSFMQRNKYKIKRKKDINKNNYYIYKEIEFYILAEYLKDIKYTLYSTDRFRQCFFLNTSICIKLNCESYLITAICTSPYKIKTEKYLHSFILIKTKGKQEYIIDGTDNFIIKKETFFKIYKPEIVSEIPKNKLNEELKLIKQFEQTRKLYRAEYLCFPEEVIKGIKKIKEKQK